MPPPAGWANSKNDPYFDCAQARSRGNPSISKTWTLGGAALPAPITLAATAVVGVAVGAARTGVGGPAAKVGVAGSAVGVSVGITARITAPSAPPASRATGSPPFGV